MLKTKKIIPESGGNHAYFLCSCGKKTRFQKLNPTKYDVGKWLSTFKCSCGFKTTLPLKKPKETKEEQLKESSRYGKIGAKKRWKK